MSLFLFGCRFLVFRVSFLCFRFPKGKFKFFYLHGAGLAAASIKFALPQIFQSPHDGRIVLGDIPGFTDVLLQVVEFARAVAQGDQLGSLVARLERGARALPGLRLLG